MAKTTVGVDIGGTKLLAVRVDRKGAVVADAAQASPKQGQDMGREVLAAARRLAGDDPAGEGLGALGIGVPGLVDSSEFVRFAANLPGVAGTPLGDDLRGELPDVRVWIGNDATAACWGEFVLGAGQGSRDMLMVTLGTGIGGGIVLDGTLVEGSNRFAAEFGHMVVDPNGPRCPCGNKGCWERFGSGAGLGVLGRELAMAGEAPRLVALAGDPESVRGEHVTQAATEGDLSAIDIMARFGWWVALGLANLATIFDPQVIVVGGGLVQAGEVLMGPTRQAFTDLVFGSSVRPPIQIVAATLGPQAGAVGAGLMADIAGVARSG